MKEQIEQRRNLLSYFINQKANAVINNLPTDAWDKLINITTCQLTDLILNEISDFFNMSKYRTAEGIKTESSSNNLHDLIKKQGLIPIDTSRVNTSENRILVIDINYLPSEYKDGSVDTTRESLEALYGCKALLIDGSRRNIEGQNCNLPVYFI